MADHRVCLTVFTFSEYRDRYSLALFRTSRGIGLEMARQLLQSPSNSIVATCRSPVKAVELQQLVDQAGGRLSLISLDVTSKESVGHAAEQAAVILGGKGIDYLVNNAGVVRVHSRVLNI